MKNLYKQKREQGFTIIEVMIVLAIAAVILLIVLLAVPALQRNNRNTQRTNDAATVAAAINTCLANHNNVITGLTGCNTVANVDYAASNAGQLKTLVFSASPGTTTTADYTFGKKCDSAGTVISGNSTSTTSFVVQYQFETSSGTLPRCISS